MNTPQHRCPWPLCPTMVPAHLWGCRHHWFRLPTKLRNAISNAYRPGQTVGTQSADYRVAASEAEKWMADAVRAGGAR